MNTDNISRTVMAIHDVRNGQGKIRTVRLISECELWSVTIDSVVIYESNDDQAAKREYLAWIEGTVS